MIIINRYVALIIVLMLCGPSTFAQFGVNGGVNSTNSMSNAQMMNIMRYLKTKEEGGNLKNWWKGEETFGLTYSGPTTYTTSMKFVPSDPSTEKPIDTTINISMTPKVGLHVNANSNHLLVRVSANSIITFSAGAQIDFLNWSYTDLNRSTGKPEDVSLGYIQAGLPLTLDFKTGGDVDFDREQKTCFAIGGGFYPRYGFGYNGPATESIDFRMTPYLYASFGFFAGACWKIRASYLPGNFSILEENSNVGRVGTTSRVTGPGIYTLGIGLMDWSWDWGKGNGWRGSKHGGGGGGRRRHVSENSRLF